VTGGAGFIGSHLVERLAKLESVAVVDDLSRGRREWLPPGVRFHAADIREPAELRRAVALSRPRVVVHLAALHFIPDVDGAPELAWAVNVDGTRNLLDALADAPPELLLFASTAAVYPNRPGPIVESCRPAPVDVYGKTKLEGERLVSRFAAATGARCVVARLFNVIGKRETNPHVVPELVTQLRGGASRVRLGNLSPKRDYTDVTDVASALAKLLEDGGARSTVFNVGSGRGVSVREVVATCEQILGRRIEVEADPARRRAHDRAELVADVSRLQRATGWSPRRSLEQTLSDLLADA
jgi:UDP-glucose 4-epimerase